MTTRIRRPEYTGENRCVPCTVLNAAIAAGAAGVVAVVVGMWLGVVSFVAFGAAIYLRGYLIPGTPTITETYAPEVLLRLFGKQPVTGRSAPVAEPTEQSDSAHVLSATGVVEFQDGDVHLMPDFRRGWRERIQGVREHGPERADVREAFDADEVAEHGHLSFVIDGTELHRWESEAALVADIAAAAELRSRSVDWSAFDIAKRTDICTGLRLLAQHCPTCDGPVSTTKNRVDPCCRKSYTIMESVCQACSETIVAVTVPGATDDHPIRTHFFDF